MKKILNRETGKIELHFSREEYMQMPDEQKSELKSAFLWSRSASAWVSRTKVPNNWRAEQISAKLGAEDGGATGERLSFAEQMERKAEKAEARADRMEGYAEHAERRAKLLQRPIADMRGDIAFFTQPNINSGAGRAFTNRRNKMFNALEKGFDEYRKSAYFLDRAATAHATAEQTRPTDPAFCDRRIRDCQKNIRAQQRNLESLDQYMAKLNAGELLHRYKGDEITVDEINRRIETALDHIDAELDRMSYYQSCLDELGGIRFSPENIKKGYTVRVARWGVCTVESVGKINLTIRFESGGTLKIQFAEVLEIVSTEVKSEQHPFKVGDKFTVHRWNSSISKRELVEYTIVRIGKSSVTLKTGDEKPIIRRPRKAYHPGVWALPICDGLDGTILRTAS